jgi:hypothetical protein
MMKCLPSLIFILLAFVQVARADGGVVLFQQTSAPFTVTMFSTEMPLRPGVADLSVLLESTERHSPILDAHIFMELEHETGVIIHTEATRSQARNKLLYCSLINLPISGHWKMKLNVSRGDSRALVLNDLMVVAPGTVFSSYWKLILLPPVIITLFLINQFQRKHKASNS